MDKPKIDNRSNTELEKMVREAKANEGSEDISVTVNTLSRRGVPKAVIDRIFVHRQRCRATDMPSGRK